MKLLSILGVTALLAGCGGPLSQMVFGPKSVPPVPTPKHSSAQAKLAGQVVFSKSPIPEAMASADGLQTRFGLTDAIHFRGFLGDVFFNHAAAEKVRLKLDASARAVLKVQIDGEQDPKKWMFLTAERLYDDDVKTRLSFTASKAKNPSLTARWHIGNGGIADDRIAERFWRSIVGALEPGEHQITFHLIFDRLEGLKGNKRVRYTKETVARGQFTLAFTADEKARFVQEHAPPIVSEQHPQEAALKPEIMAALRRYSPKQTPLRVMTASADWFVEMSPLHGRPVERRLLAYVVHRDAKGICHLSGMYYGQAFVGNGYSKRLERSAGSTDSKPFPCEAPLKRRAP